MKLKVAAAVVAVTLIAAGVAYWYFIMDDEYNVSFPRGSGYKIEYNGTIYAEGFDASVRAGGSVTFSVTVGGAYEAETLEVTANGKVLTGTGSSGHTYTIDNIGNDVSITITVDPLPLPVSFYSFRGFTAVPDSDTLVDGDVFSFTLEPKPGYSIDNVEYSTDGGLREAPTRLIPDGHSYSLTVTGSVMIYVDVTAECGCECEAETCDDCDAGCGCACCSIAEFLAGNITKTELLTALSGLERPDGEVPGASHELYGFITETYDGDLVREIYGPAVIYDPYFGYMIVFGPDSDLTITTTSLGSDPVVELDGTADITLIGNNPLGDGCTLNGEITINGVTFCSDDGAVFDFEFDDATGNMAATVRNTETLTVSSKLYGYKPTEFNDGQTWSTANMYYEPGMDPEDLIDLLIKGDDESIAVGGNHVIYGAITETYDGSEIVRKISGIAVIVDSHFGYTIVFGPDSELTITTTSLGSDPEVTIEGTSTDVTIIDNNPLGPGCTLGGVVTINGVTFDSAGVVFDFDFDPVTGNMSATVVSGTLTVSCDDPVYSRVFTDGMTWSTANLYFGSLSVSELIDLLIERDNESLAVGGNHVIYGAITETYDGSEIVRVISGIAVIVDPLQGYTTVFGPDSNLTITTIVLGLNPEVKFSGYAEMTISGSPIGTLTVNGIKFTPVVNPVEFVLITDAYGNPFEVNVITGEIEISIGGYIITIDEDDDGWVVEDILTIPGTETGSPLGGGPIWGLIEQDYDGAGIITRVISGMAVIDDTGGYFDYKITFAQGSKLTMTTDISGSYQYPVVEFDGYAFITIEGYLELNGATLTDGSWLVIDGVEYRADGGDVLLDIVWDDGADPMLSIYVLFGTLLADGAELP